MFPHVDSILLSTLCCHFPDSFITIKLLVELSRLFRTHIPKKITILLNMNMFMFTLLTVAAMIFSITSLPTLLSSTSLL